jgi:hypothetical protein
LLQFKQLRTVWLGTKNIYLPPSRTAWFCTNMLFALYTFYFPPLTYPSFANHIPKEIKISCSFQISLVWVVRVNANK